MPMTIDHPRTREDRTCPICDLDKPIGIFVCWPCYRLHGMRYGNPTVASIIDAREVALRA
jgi:hypothetical protein